MTTTPKAEGKAVQPSLLDAVNSVIEAHDLQAIRCNFGSCGCEVCKVLRPAAVTEAEQQDRLAAENKRLRDALGNALMYLKDRAPVQYAEARSALSQTGGKE